MISPFADLLAVVRQLKRGRRGSATRSVIEDAILAEQIVQDIEWSTPLLLIKASHGGSDRVVEQQPPNPAATTKPAG